MRFLEIKKTRKYHGISNPRRDNRSVEERKKSTRYFEPITKK
jgi:hypothetical protein